MKITSSRTSSKDNFRQSVSYCLPFQASRVPVFNKDSFIPLPEKKKSSSSCFKSFFSSVTSFFKWVESFFSSSAKTSTSDSRSTKKKKSHPSRKSSSKGKLDSSGGKLDSSKGKLDSSKGKLDSSGIERVQSTAARYVFFSSGIERVQSNAARYAFFMEFFVASKNLPDFFAFMSFYFSNPEQLFEKLTALHTSLDRDNASNFHLFLCKGISWFALNEKIMNTPGGTLVREFLHLEEFDNGPIMEYSKDKEGKLYFRHPEYVVYVKRESGTKLIENLLLSFQSGNYEQFKDASEKIWLSMFKLVPQDTKALNAEYEKVEPFVKQGFSIKEKEKAIQEEFKQRFQAASRGYLEKVKRHFSF